MNEIIQGDCLDILPKIQDNSIDLIITSPPYNLGVKYDTYNDKINVVDYYIWCRVWLKELFRILKPDGRFCLNHYLSCGTAEERLTPLMTLNEIATTIGFKHYGLAVWNDITLSKNTAWGSWLSASAPYINAPFEGILIFYKERWKKDNIGISTISKKEFMESCGGVWNLNPSKDKEHPATFPISLPMRCINLLSYKKDLILDPFCGIGTTCLAAKLLQRNYIGIDISEKYCNIAKERLKVEILNYD